MQPALVMAGKCPHQRDGLWGYRRGGNWVSLLKVHVKE